MIDSSAPGIVQAKGTVFHRSLLLTSEFRSNKVTKQLHEMILYIIRSQVWIITHTSSPKEDSSNLDVRLSWQRELLTWLTQMPKERKRTQ